jgi:very-short-patch-repair endonuclease
MLSCLSQKVLVANQTGEAYESVSRRNRIVTYSPKLRSLARALRKNSPFAEIILWQSLKGRALGCEFHRQVPMDQYIVDFFCHERMVAIEIDGCSHDDLDAYARDETKDKRLSDLGIRVLRFRDIRVLENVISVIDEIRSVLDESETCDS